MPRFAFQIASTLLATAALLPAQWVEAGDAGELPATAQVPNGTVTSLTSIAGTLAAGDVDMFLIDIVDPVAFTASTVGGTTVDTQLFLFFRDGRGVTHHDGFTGSTGPQSLITGNFVPFAGSYYLAISEYDRDPRSAGQLIWNDQPWDIERRADGPRRYESVDSWGGFSGAGGAYTIALTGCTRPGKEVVLPDNHHLTESANQLASTGSTNWWRGGGGRFQVIYEASHFVNAGTSSPVWLDKLLFRGEDGEPNLGGQSWANVTVQLARTTMTPATMGTDFAANLAAATNLSSVATFPTVTAARSIGSTPNNYNIALDLYQAILGYNYDPSQGNLLVDVTMPAAATLPPASGPVMPMQDTTGGLTVVRGAGVYAAIGATTGTLSTAPPVMAFKIDGPGGASHPIPARNEFYGAACGGAPSTFYQSFLNGQPFDLIGLTLTPNDPATPGFYAVAAGAGAFDATKVNAAPNSTSDDATVAFTLGYTFNYPGGSTGAIRPCTNGYVWLNGTTTTADFSPTLGELLGSTINSPARMMPCWYDLHAGRNTAIHPNSGMHVLNDTTGGAGNTVTYVTWLNVGAFNTVSGTGIGGHAVYNMQMVLHEATGVVEFRYGTMPDYCSNTTTTNPSHPAFTGFTRGRIGTVASVDPQSRDLSVEVPFTTSVEGAFGNMGLTAVATPTGGGSAYGGRMFPAQSVTWNASNVPPGSVIGVMALDLVPSRPGFVVPGITAPGCMLSLSTSAQIHEVTLLPGATVTGVIPINVPPGVSGAEIFAQYLVLDGLFGGPDLITVASNALRHQIGLQ